MTDLFGAALVALRWRDGSGDCLPTPSVDWVYGEVAGWSFPHSNGWVQHIPLKWSQKRAVFWLLRRGALETTTFF